MKKNIKIKTDKLFTNLTEKGKMSIWGKSGLVNIFTNYSSCIW